MNSDFLDVKVSVNVRASPDEVGEWELETALLWIHDFDRDACNSGLSITSQPASSIRGEGLTVNRIN